MQTNLRNKALINDLFYLLAGFDTPTAFISGDPSTIINTSALDFRPFEFLIVKIREFYNIEPFEEFVQRYLQRLHRLKESASTIEEVFVGVQEDIDTFRELDRIYSTILKDERAFPFTSYSGNSPIMKHFITQETIEIHTCINQWINQAIPGKLVEMRKLDEFSMCPWKDLFKIKRVNLSKDELARIEETGKIVHTIRTLFGLEVIQDEGVREEREDMLSFFNYNGDITIRRNELLKILSNLTAKKLSSEVKNIQDIVFLQDGTLVQEILERFECVMFSTEKITERLNVNIRMYFENKADTVAWEDGRIEFIECESTLGDYIMKLLKFQRMPASNAFLINAQRIGICFRRGLIEYFVPRRTFLEMEILFRFLFSVSVCAFYLQKSKKYAFTHVLFLIFMKIKEKSIDFGSKFFVSCDNNVARFSTEFPQMITDLLNRFYIINSTVFPIWIRLIDLCMEYLQIEYKDHISEAHFNEQTTGCVNEMIREIKKECGECELTDFLGNLLQ